MPDFTRIIDLAYQRILGRPPDPGGVDSYNQAMNSGLTEAQMRESLLRSAEYAENNPLAIPATEPALDVTTHKKKTKKIKRAKKPAGRRR